jgi:NADPH:quinone reductase
MLGDRMIGSTLSKIIVTVTFRHHVGLRSTRVHGVVCFTGMLSNQWIVRDFYPVDYIPNGVRLTAYSGDSSDLSSQVLQEFLDAVAAGKVIVPVGHVYHFDEIVQAHTAMEAGSATGKLVVTT